MSGGYCLVNDLPVGKAHITRPRIGPWIADLAIPSDSAAAFEGGVTITLPDAGLSFRGTAHRVGVHHGIVYLRAVGGAGGLDTVLAPKSYRNVSSRIVLQDIASAAGETLSGSCDPAALDAALAFWTRPRQTARRALFSLLTALGGPAWRILPDGTLWVGAETWSASDAPFQDEEFEPHLGRLTIDSGAPTMSPGQTLAYDGQVRRISTVSHEVESDRVRHVLLFEGEGEGDRLKVAINSYVRDLFPRVDFTTGYWATVVKQNSDGSLELQPDDPRFAGWSGPPIRYGVPGMTAKVSPGARCLLEFAGADPQRPMVTAWEPGTILELDVTASAIKFGAGATEALVKGTTYRTAEDTLLTALVTALGTIAAATTPSTAAAATTFATAVTNFKNAAASYLSTVGTTA